jgi:hypothetical protein
MLATMAVSTALGEAVPDVTDMVADVTTRFSCAALRPSNFAISSFPTTPWRRACWPCRTACARSATCFPTPLPRPSSKRSRSMRGSSFAPTCAEIVALSAPGDKVRAGARLPLRVTLRPYAGAEFAQTLEVDVPPALAGRTVKIEVASGAQVKPEVPRAEDLRGFVENLRAYYPASSLVVSLTTRDDGASLRGRLIRNLPASALDTLKPANQTRRADSFHVVKRAAFPGSRPDHWTAGDHRAGERPPEPRPALMLLDHAQLRPAAARMEVDGQLSRSQSSSAGTARNPGPSSRRRSRTAFAPARAAAIPPSRRPWAWPRQRPQACPRGRAPRSHWCR